MWYTDINIVYNDKATVKAYKSNAKWYSVIMMIPPKCAITIYRSTTNGRNIKKPIVANTSSSNSLHDTNLFKRTPAMLLGEATQTYANWCKLAVEVETTNNITAMSNIQPHNTKQSSENVTTTDNRYRHYITLTIYNSAENPLRMFRHARARCSSQIDNFIIYRHFTANHWMHPHNLKYHSHNNLHIKWVSPDDGAVQFTIQFVMTKHRNFNLLCFCVLIYATSVPTEALFYIINNNNNTWTVFTVLSSLLNIVTASSLGSSD